MKIGVRDGANFLIGLKANKIARYLDSKECLGLLGHGVYHHYHHVHHHNHHQHYHHHQQQHHHRYYYYLF